MDCSACERENPTGARFCNGCGAPLSAACASCGHGNPPASSFCNACGERLTPASEASAPAGEASQSPDAPSAYTPAHLAERILQSRAAMEGERKNVTVLFCDLADSTALAERIGAEAMHEIMDRCFALILDQVHRFEGTVNQFLGDGVMALFGAPLALEDAPRRAVAAALAVQRSLGPLSEEVARRYGAPLHMRVGIHSGPVVVGRIGDDLRMDYTAVGDTTNLASRLQAAAPPGAVLVSEATRSSVEGFFDLEDRGSFDLKGKAEPVRAFVAQRERSVPGRVEAQAERGLTPLVGRELELAALQRAFDSAASGVGQVAFLVGEAGIGKSRLRYEFQRSLAGRPHRWAEGRCMTYARDFPFHPIIDALRQAFGIDSGDDDAVALERMDRVESEAGGELAWTLPYLKTLLSLPSGDEEVDAMDAATRRSRTFDALRAQLQRAARDAPFVFVIEDIHWIDKASEEFLAFVIDSVPASRILLVLTHRPGYRHPFGDRSFYLRLSLQPLSPAEMGRMAEQVLAAHSVPGELRDLIAARAEGNPFFVEEVIQSLVEDGTLRPVAGRVEVARKLDGGSVPDSIQDVLMARLDRLADEPKRALQLGAVIGREFALRLLEHAAAVGGDIEPVIDELRSLELIYETAAHPELAFMFKHALTRDVAYDSVLESRRKELHRLVGLAIEELYRDRLAEHFDHLAHHFTAAEEWDKAFFYDMRAAERAAEAFANQSAREYARRALAIAERLGEAVSAATLRELEELLGMCTSAMSEFQASGDAFLRAAELADDPTDVVLNLGRAAHGFAWGHHYPQMDEAVAACARLSREHGLGEGLAFAKTLEVFRHAIVAEFPEQDRLLEEVERLAPTHPEVVIVLRYLQGQYAEWCGRYREAAAAQAEGVELARKHRLPGLLIPGQWSRAKAHCCLGQYGEALRLIRDADELAERIGDRHQRTRMLNTLGWIHAELGADELAEDFNRRSVETAQELLDLELVAGVNEIHGNASINKAGNRIALEDLAGADAVLEPVRADLAGGDDPWMRWRYSLHLQDAEARLWIARGEPERALPLLDEELAGARRNDAAKLVARALELRGRAWLHLDERGAAEESLREALASTDAIGYPPIRRRALALLGELARRRGHDGEAEKHHADAAATLAALAEPFEEEPLRRRFLQVGERLRQDPLAALR